jgi:hypothetical protein
MKHLMFHCFIAVNTIYIHAEIAIKQRKTFQQICKGKDDDVYRLCYGNYGNNCQRNSSLQRFCVLIFFFIKALSQWRQIREAMKR